MVIIMTTIPNIQWNESHEKFLKKITKEIYVMSEMHKHVAMNYSKKNKYLGTPSILIGTVATSSVFSNSDVSYMVYVNGSLVLLSTLMNSLRNWLDYDNRSTGHKQLSIEYESLVIDIVNQLNNEVHYREPVDQFMKSIKDRYIALKKSQLNIPDHVYEKFMDKVEVFMSKITDQQPRTSDYTRNRSPGCCRRRATKSYQPRSVQTDNGDYTRSAPQQYETPRDYSNRYEDDDDDSNDSITPPSVNEQNYDEIATHLRKNAEMTRRNQDTQMTVLPEPEPEPLNAISLGGQVTTGVVSSRTSAYNMPSIEDDFISSMDQRVQNAF